ncbi:MAG: hypothetical protein DSZ05_03000 [Sulfurospirillum sp.]|nr:MAG: hypothetical protein DSZ05_03000 [Sulfurospirillum sp.]
MNIFETITGKIDKIVLIFAVVVLTASFYFVYTLSHSYAQKETVHSLENALLLTRNMLDEEQQHALSLSLLLSEDKTFLEAFYGDDRKKTFEIIREKLASLKKLQGYTFEVQVHDKNLHTFLRSWDFSIKGVPLASFREGLVLVKERKKPLVSIEVGKRLNIKAISPILKQGKFQGSIEVIEGFAHLREKLSEQGYALFILLDKEYLSVATTLTKHPLLENRFVLVNTHYDKNSYESLKNATLDQLGSYGYFTHSGYVFGYFDIRNFHGKRLGYFVIALQKSAPVALKARYESDVSAQNESEVIIR